MQMVTCGEPRCRREVFVISCFTLNFVPKTIDASGNLSCSQIYDDSKFVGIATTSPFVVNGTTSKL